MFPNELEHTGFAAPHRRQRELFDGAYAQVPQTLRPDLWPI